MNINDKLRILVREMGLTNITFDGMEISYMDRWYWLAYYENGREIPTTVGFPDCERVNLECDDNGDNFLVISNDNGKRRFVRRIYENPYFELESSFDNIEKLIKRGVKFSIVEDGKDKFRFSSNEVQAIVSVRDGISIQFKDTTIWISLSENSKVRLYI